MAKSAQTTSATLGLRLCGMQVFNTALGRFKHENAELVNSRAAMIGFLMLVLTELVFNGEPVTSSIFAIN